MEEKIGRVTHYFGKIGVAAIEIQHGKLRRGDRIHIVGHTTNLEQVIDSIEIDRQPVDEAVEGQSVGVKVVDHVREHDEVFKVV
ncbi:MAG: EF-Tu/IF-2/RF-3 family GTPase [Armatimonadota bacterium]